MEKMSKDDLRKALMTARQDHKVIIVDESTRLMSLSVLPFITPKIPIGEGNHLLPSRPEIGEVRIVGTCRADERPEIVREVIRFISPEEIQEKIQIYVPVYSTCGGWEVKTSLAENDAEKALIEEYMGSYSGKAVM